MSFFEFGSNDIIHTSIVAYPKCNVTYQGQNVTGSVYLERPYSTTALSMRQMQGFSERLGGLTTKFAGLTSSISITYAVKNGSNQGLYGAIQNLFSYYAVYNSRYSFATASTSFQVINIPEVYYDRSILSGTFVGNDVSASGSSRYIRDDGFGGLYAGTNSGSLVGNIFYSEGIAVLTDPTLGDFGVASTGSFHWQFSFAGTHTIPVNIYRCRAPGGELNASTNRTFYTVPVSGALKNTRQVLTSSLTPYITAVGLYNEDYELVGVARLAQPIRKEFGWDVCVNLKMDW